MLVYSNLETRGLKDLSEAFFPGVFGKATTLCGVGDLEA